MGKRVYCDYAATAPLLEVSRKAFLDALDIQANPSSLHGSGRAARRCVEQSREKLASALGAHPSEIIFTSGGTEADNLAIKGLYWQRMSEAEKRGRECRRILVSSVEHPAVAEAAEWLAKHEAAQIDWIPVDGDAVVDCGYIADKVERYGEEIALISVMWANNEVGTIQPMQKVIEIAETYRIPVHSDAVQAFGAVPTDFKSSGLSAMSVSGHKIGAPVGVGALVTSRTAELVPVHHGGGQERGVRSGTLDVASVSAFAAAAQHVVAQRVDGNAKLTELSNRLIAGMQKVVPEAVLCGPRDGSNAGKRLPGHVYFVFPGCEGDSILFLLDRQGIDTSTGSACTAGVSGPSAVLTAMGFPQSLARSGQRFSFGHASTLGDVDAVLEVLGEAYRKARAAGMSAAFSGIKTPRMYGMKA